MNTYRFKVHVERIGVVEETVGAATPSDAERLIRARYSPLKVVVYTFVQVS
jgi:hypothetical protein